MSREYHIVLSFKDIITDKELNQDVQDIYESICLDEDWDPDSDSDFVCFVTSLYSVFDKFMQKHKHNIVDPHFSIVQDRPLIHFKDLDNHGTGYAAEKMKEFIPTPFIVQKGYVLTDNRKKSLLVATATFIAKAPIKVTELNYGFMKFRKVTSYPKPAVVQSST